MRILICGDRKWQYPRMVETVLHGLYEEDSCGWLTVDAMPFIVISGMAPGADTHAAEWVWYSPLHGEVVNLDEYDYMTYDSPHGMPVALMKFPANWEKYGKGAGPIRNQQMLDEGKPDLVIAFHNDLENSKGTKDMVARAKKAGIPTYVVAKVV